IEADLSPEGCHRLGRRRLAEYGRGEIARQHRDRREDHDRDDEQRDEPEPEPLQYCPEDWVHAVNPSPAAPMHANRCQTTTAKWRFTPRQRNARNGPPPSGGPFPQWSIRRTTSSGRSGEPPALGDLHAIALPVRR